MSKKVLIRLVGAPLILAALAGCLWLDWHFKNKYAISAVLFLFSAGAFHEICAMGRLKGFKPAEVLGLIALVVVYVLAARGHWPGGWHVDAQTLAVGVLLLLISLMILRYPGFAPGDAGFTYFALCYVMLLSSIYLVGRTSDSWLRWLLFLVATAKGSDMAAYSFGKMIGKHKCAPVISPNKTWEGTIAGFLAGTVLGGMILLQLPFVEMNPVALWALAACVTVAAQFGDLAKSAIKRWAGVKDSGQWLPEFGGALDMVDSFLLSVPVAILGIIYFKYI